MHVAIHVKYAFKSSFVYNTKHKNVLSVRRMPAWLNVLFFVFIFFFSSSISFLTQSCSVSLILPSVFCVRSAHEQCVHTCISTSNMDRFTYINPYTDTSFVLVWVSQIFTLKVSHSIYFLSSVLVPFFLLSFSSSPSISTYFACLALEEMSIFFSYLFNTLINIHNEKELFLLRIGVLFSIHQKKKKKRLQRAIFDGFGIHSKWLSQ